MEPRILNDVIKQIRRRFPEMTGVRPKVQAQRAGQSNGTYLLIFHNHVRVAGELSLPRALRVVVDEEGNILKISTSR